MSKQETKDAKCKILNYLIKINNKHDEKKNTIGNNFKLENLQKNTAWRKVKSSGENVKVNENISEVIRPQIFTLTLKQNKQKTHTQPKIKDIEKSGLSST